MVKFKDRDIVLLHDCLKTVNVTNKIPESKIMDYYVNVIDELFDPLSDEQKLGISLFIAHDTLLSVISKREDIDDLSNI